MKKLLLVCMILCLFLFAACGNQTEPTNAPEQNPQNITEDADLPTEAEEVQDATQEEKTEAAAEIRGTVTDNTYRNEFIGIEIALDDSWTFYDDEQIAALYGLTAERAGEEYSDLIANAPIVYDMQVMGANQIDSIGVNLEKFNAVLLESMDLSVNLQNSVEIIKTSYENMGYSDIQTEISTVDIGDQTFDCLNITVSIGGMVMNQRTITIKCGDYIASISLTAIGEDALNDMLNQITLIG